MSTFYPQLLSSESLSQQWQRYIEYKPVLQNIEEIIQEQSNQFKSVVERSSEDQIQAIQSSTQAMCESVESGFDMMSEHFSDLKINLTEINSELAKIAALLHWGFARIVEQQRITNMLLGNIAILLKIPEVQKERQYYLEQGIKFMKNSFFDNDFYDDALNNLLKAESIETSDYFTLHKIGVVYLYSTKHKNLGSAETYFKKAAKYAVVETNSGAAVTQNFLSGDMNEYMPLQVPAIPAIKIQAAESYHLAAVSCFLQNKFDEAATLAGQAYSLAPAMLDAGLTQVQALCAANRTREGVIILKTLIEKDRFITLRVLPDSNLMRKTEVKNLLEDCRMEAFDEANTLYLECQDNIIEDSVAETEMREIEKLIHKKTFLHGKKAIDLLRLPKERIFSDAYPENNKSVYKSNRNFIEFREIVTQLNSTLNPYYADIYYSDEQSLLENQVESISQIEFSLDIFSQSSQWVLIPRFECSTANREKEKTFKWMTSCEITPKTMNSPLIDFVKQEREYFSILPKLKGDLIDKTSQIVREMTKLVDLSRAKQKQSMRQFEVQRSISQVLSIAIFLGTLIFGFYYASGHKFPAVALFVGGVLLIFRVVSLIGEGGNILTRDLIQNKIFMAAFGICVGILAHWII